jgi:hypothetical protein
MRLPRTASEERMKVICQGLLTRRSPRWTRLAANGRGRLSHASRAVPK